MSFFCNLFTFYLNGLQLLCRGVLSTFLDKYSTTRYENEVNDMKSKYDSHVKPYIDLIKSMRIEGHTEANIYKRLGVSHNTWERYKNNHSEIREALKISKAGLIGKLEQTLFQKALEGNPTLLIFALKNLAPEKWGEKVKVDASVKGDEFINAIKRFADKL